MSSTAARALGALSGLAIGDALGMPTQSLPRDVIVERYGLVIDGFHRAPPDHPLAAGLPAGSITDDTEQALLLGRLLLDGGGAVDPAELGRRLLAWEDDMRARGSVDLLGPSTRLAVTNLLAGVPVEQAGNMGTTNGAAMRITPVGIANPGDDLGNLVDQVAAASSLSHNTSTALAGASAVAAAVSAGISGATVAQAVQTGVDAAQLGQLRGNWTAGAEVAARIAWAVDMVANRRERDVFELVYRLVGTSLATQESVPAAMAVFSIYGDDPFLACRIAASLGGDCDTIGAMVGAMSGACHGVDAFPQAALDQVLERNKLDLAPLAAGLLRLRER